MSEDFLIPLISYVIAAVPFVALFVVIARVLGRRGNTPVEWPEANIGVAQIRSLGFASAPDKQGRLKVTMSVAVEPEQGAPFTSELVRQIPQHKCNRLQQGMLFPVMYRPDRQQKVKIARGKHEKRGRAFFNLVRMRDGLIDEPTLLADAHGNPARALVQGIRPTGRFVRGLREFQLALHVQPLRGESFQITKTMPLLEFEATAVAPGITLPARYMPNTPGAVAVSMRPKIQKPVSQAVQK